MQTDTPNPTQQQKKTGLQWRGKDFTFRNQAAPLPASALPTTPTQPTPNTPTSTPTHPFPVNSTPTPTSTASAETSDQGMTLDQGATLDRTPLSEHTLVHMKPAPAKTGPVYTNPSLSRVGKSPAPVTLPKTGARPVPPSTNEERKRKADQMSPSTPEVQHKRRVVQAMQSDAKSAGQPALTPFSSTEDVLARLLPFHIFQPVDTPEALVEAPREDELWARYQTLLEQYHVHACSSARGEETLLTARLLWSEQREELSAQRELLNKYLAQLHQQRQLQQQLLHNTSATPGAVKVIASTPHTAPRVNPLNVVVAPGMAKGLIAAQTIAFLQKVSQNQPRPTVTPVNVVPVPISKDEHVINVPQNKS